MHEPVTHCKEGNPFVSIPAGMISIVAGCSCLQTVNSWPRQEGLFENVLAFILCIMTFVFIGFVFTILLLSISNMAPCTIYFRTKSVRVWLVISITASLALFAHLLAQIEKPGFFEILTTLFFVLSVFGCVLLTVNIFAALAIVVTDKIKPERKNIGESLLTSIAGAAVACVSLGFHARGSYPIGGQIFLLSSVSSIAILWMEHRESCIADREITPLAMTSIAWMTATFAVKQYHAELSAISFATPYFIYLVPVGMLGAYYYITQPERS